MATYTTAFASLDHYDKGGVELINDDPKNYVFSNMFDVASAARPWEKVAVAKNMEYVLEVIRAEGTSEWRAAPHDEFALVVDGEVVVDLLDPAEPHVDPGAQGRWRSTASRTAPGWGASPPAGVTWRCCRPGAATGSAPSGRA
jgi:hypothetical protein